MKKISLQWRITLMTAILIGITCVSMNSLIGYSGRHYMDSIGSGISANSDSYKGEQEFFDPESADLDQEVTIIVNGAQFVCGIAGELPLHTFASRVENVQPNNLPDMKITDDVPAEFKQFSISFNQMLDRLDEGFTAQRQFTGNAAHELRTPLALLQAQLELFSVEHPNLDAESADFLKLLQEQTERMSQVTKTLLEMSELRTVPCNDCIELAPMIEEILADLSPVAEKKGVTLECDGTGTMVGSDTLIYRLIFNLTENAIRYNRPDGTVRVSVSQEGDDLVVRVADTGCGIPEKYKESIFQPFFRVDKSRSRENGGVGLGLSLVWEIADIHGGKVQAEESTEKGTVMTVTFPLNKEYKDD